MSFQEVAGRGDIVGTLRTAAVTGSLWAIGSAWAISIRAVVRALFPTDTLDVVLAEVVAALITTAFGTILAVALAYDCCKRRPSTVVDDPPPLPTRVRPSRVKR